MDDMANSKTPESEMKGINQEAREDTLVDLGAASEVTKGMETILHTSDGPVFYWPKTDGLSDE